MSTFKLLDTVATLQTISAERLILVESEYRSVASLPVGQVGTIVEIYPADSPHYLVEFADLQGREYAMAVLRAEEILALSYELAAVQQM